MTGKLITDIGTMRQREAYKKGLLDALRYAHDTYPLTAWLPDIKEAIAYVESTGELPKE